MDVADTVEFDPKLVSDDYDSDKEDYVPVKLKEGINLKELIDKSVATFEVNEEDTYEEENNYFDSSELINVNFECLDIGSDDDDENQPERTPFQRLASKMQNLVTDGSVKKRIIQHGAGPVVPPGSLVTIHYNAYTEYTDEPYDSTYLRGQPHKFRLGKGIVIPGLDAAVSSMKKGEKSRFLLQPAVAFGKMGCPPRIPPDAELFFELELVNYIDNVAVAEYEALTEEEKKTADFSKALKASRAEISTANALFKGGHIPAAINRYRKAAYRLEAAAMNSEEEEKLQKHELLRLYVNMAISYNKIKEPKKACTACKEALKIDPNNAKALFNFGKALNELSDYKEAKKKLLAARAKLPNCPEITQELKKLESKMKKYSEDSTNFFKGMFSNEDKKNKPEPQKSTSIKEFEQVLQEALVDFLKDEKQKKMLIPSGLTATEEMCVKEHAKQMGLSVRESKQGTTKSMILEKDKDAEALKAA